MKENYRKIETKSSGAKNLTCKNLNYPSSPISVKVKEAVAENHAVLSHAVEEEHTCRSPAVEPDHVSSVFMCTPLLELFSVMLSLAQSVFSEICSY